MKGTRLYPDLAGWLPPDMPPGSYGRATNAEVAERVTGWWQVCAPDGSQGCLDPKVHNVVEHEDGTISVTPSLDFSKRKSGAYHGHLTRGEWTGA